MIPYGSKKMMKKEKNVCLCVGLLLLKNKSLGLLIGNALTRVAKKEAALARDACVRVWIHTFIYQYIFSPWREDKPHCC